MKKWIIPFAVLLIFASQLFTTDSTVDEIKPPEDGLSIEAVDVIEEVVEPVEVRVDRFDFEGLVFGTLDYRDLILTTYNAVDSVGMTFRSDLETSAVVTVLNVRNEVVGIFRTLSERVDLYESHQMVHKTILSGLESGETYRYLIEADGVFSQMFAFEALPSERPITMGFFGDTQGYKMSQYDTFRKVYEIANENRRLDISFIAGDIVDDGASLAQWRFFHESIEGYGTSRLWLTAIGNHDVKNTSKLYESSFNYPPNGVQGLAERNFYIDLPSARIAVWDTESASRFEDQSEWLKKVMAVDGFKIILMHRSVYPMSYDEGYIRKLALVFESCGIDLVLSGHDHVYSRTTIMDGEKALIDEGVTYIVGGSSTGSKFYSEKKGRPWKEVVYDDDNPVYTLLEIDDHLISIDAYAVIDGRNILVDHLVLTDENE